MRHWIGFITLTCALGGFGIGTAMAQESPPVEGESDAVVHTAGEVDSDFDNEAQPGGPTTDDDTRRGVTNPDPVPAPPSPVTELPETGVYEQAGTGGTIAFGEAGVLELGGAGAFTAAKDLTILSVRPSIGWFVLDNVELSAMLNFDYANTSVEATDSDTDVDNVSSTTFGLMGEPSFHLPFTPTLFGFAGLGLGVNYDGDDFGFALRPRVGLDVIVGRSAIFRPALEFTWTTTDAVTQNGNAVVGVSQTFGASFGYSAMW